MPPVFRRLTAPEPLLSNCSRPSSVVSGASSDPIPAPASMTSVASAPAVIAVPRSSTLAIAPTALMRRSTLLSVTSWASAISPPETSLNAPEPASNSVASPRIRSLPLVRLKAPLAERMLALLFRIRLPPAVRLMAPEPLATSWFSINDPVSLSRFSSELPSSDIKASKRISPSLVRAMSAPPLSSRDTTICPEPRLLSEMLPSVWTLRLPVWIWPPTSPPAKICSRSTIAGV